MSDKIPTLEEYFDSSSLNISNTTEYQYVKSDVIKAAKELIQMHIEAALKAAWENWEFEEGCDTHGVFLKEESILNAYNKNLII